MSTFSLDCILAQGRALLLDGAWEGKMCPITFDSDGGTKVLSEMHNAILYLVQNFLVVLF